MVRVTEELAKTGLAGDELIEKAFIEVIGEQTVPAGKERG
jgi:glutamate synthase (NADPH/NADH) large chain